MGSNISEEQTSQTNDHGEIPFSQESLGSYLRKERLKKGLNLREIAEGTCIHIASLKALEDDDESRMPAEVFTRGFLRLYAEYIDLDPDSVLRRYDRDKEEAKRRREDLVASDKKSKCCFLASGSCWKILAALLLAGLLILGLFLYWEELPFVT